MGAANWAALNKVPTMNEIKKELAALGEAAASDPSLLTDKGWQTGAADWTAEEVLSALPKPYYCQDHVTIYHGVCREILPMLPMVDLVITDPPYGQRFQSNHRTVLHDAITGDDAVPLAAIKACIAKATHAAYVFCRWDKLIYMPVPRSLLVWVKNNWSMGDLEHEHGRQWEACCFYPRYAHRFVTRISDVLHADRTGNKLHPTEKPVPLLVQIIRANVGDVVLDPFCGSGSTLVAARNLGREAIGIETEEKYCEVAAKRFSQKAMW